MSSKIDILDNIKRNSSESYPMPELRVDAITYPDPVAQFVTMSETVGASVHILKPSENINEVIRQLYPQSKTIASNMEAITVATLNPDEVLDAHKLDAIDLAVVAGQLGVAENGSVAIAQNVKFKALYFIAEYLVIVLDRKHIVHTMHEAYEQFIFNDTGFATFISGPSKTADIEQALVIGAHGAKGLTVILS